MQRRWWILIEIANESGVAVDEGAVELCRAVLREEGVEEGDPGFASWLPCRCAS